VCRQHWRGARSFPKLGTKQHYFRERRIVRSVERVSNYETSKRKGS